MIFIFTFNYEQEQVINAAIQWFYDKNSPQVFEYTGYPGTGKSVVLCEIVRRLGLDMTTEVAAMTYIGTASLVMRMKGFATAKTAHSWCYNIVEEPKIDKHGNVVMDELYDVPVMVRRFIKVEHLSPEIRLIAVDEGYCFPKKVGEDIKKFGIKIIACGDPNQLPPVGDEPAFLTSNNVMRLVQCMRQMGREDINYIADRAMARIPIANGFYGNSLVIDKTQLTDEMLLWADMVLCCRNKTRDYINRRIRKLKGYKTDLPQYGERVICRCNKWDFELEDINGIKFSATNGMICKVMSSPDVSSYKNGLFEMSFSPELNPNLVFENRKCNFKHMVGYYAEREALKENMYTRGLLFEYAYCVTPYLAQGSQFHKVLYIEEHGAFKDIKGSINLVAATRADQSLIYVKPD